MEKEFFGDRDEDAKTHSEHLQRMVEFYASTAPSYNQWHCDLTNESSHNYAVQEILSLMKEVRAKSLLDVCCGTGRATQAALAAGYEARGIDISPELLEIAHRELKIPSTLLDRGDATQLPYADGSFDVACILGALHHTARPRLVVSELLRVARYGIVISDAANTLSGGIKALLTRAGIFEPVYRAIFRRAPRTARRRSESDSDGPTFYFSIEEIIPLVKAHFPEFKCLTFYRLGGRDFCSYRFSRLFARQGIVSAWRYP